MKLCIIIPAHNEENFIIDCLKSLTKQSRTPDTIIVVDDHSTDNTYQLVHEFSKKNTLVKVIKHQSSPHHAPGSKVVNAFNFGKEQQSETYDIYCKFDADLEFPENYIELMLKTYQEFPEVGMCGGVCSILRNGEWVEEKLSNSDHLRGPIKSYRKDCLNDIGGLKSSMGWDSLDELMARYHGWAVHIDPCLEVKHKRPTQNKYQKKIGILQAEVFYKLGYTPLLLFIAAFKIGVLKGNTAVTISCIQKFFELKKNKHPKLVNDDEAAFIRRYRWQGIKHKILKL
ncbi:MAG: glycosyltransferase family A protein [Flavobacteriaceae bacterium]|nr:glycosyltransferase family A protein [Flavobacteriaceae bacterium]